MRRATAAYVVWFGLIGPVGAAAQAPPESPPGPYVVDVHVGISGLPNDPTFFPPGPSGTLIPTSGPGVDVGAHVYLIGLGPARVGIGASVLRAAGRRSQLATRSGSGSTAAELPDVDVRVTTIAPQVSFNFGTSDGWSYLSAGVGPANVRTTVAAFESSSESGAEGLTPETSLDSPSLVSFNVGGGARWFTSRHLAFSFDVRFHIVSSGPGEAPTPRTTLVAASAGISLK